MLVHQPMRLLESVFPALVVVAVAIATPAVQVGVRFNVMMDVRKVVASVCRLGD